MMRSILMFLLFFIRLNFLRRCLKFWERPFNTNPIKFIDKLKRFGPLDRSVQLTRCILLLGSLTTIFKLNLDLLKQRHKLLLRLSLNLTHNFNRPLIKSSFDLSLDLEMSSATDGACAARSARLALNQIFFQIYQFSLYESLQISFMTPHIVKKGQFSGNKWILSDI